MGVGFEFATGWKIFKLRDGSNVPQGGITSKAEREQLTQQYPKAASVRGGLGWKMTVDGDEIEYVVNEVDESEAGANQLVGVMRDLHEFMKMMNARNMQSHLTADNFPNGTFREPNDRFVIEIAQDMRLQDIEAIPQVTGGVRLARIRKLWRLLADPQSNAAKQFFSESKGGMPVYSSIIRQVTIDWKQIKDSNWDHDPSAKLRGLVTLIATYIMRGYSPQQYGVGAVKYLFIMMSRTKFSALFNDLPQVEQKHYRKAPDDWVSFICKDVMSKIGGTPSTGVTPDGLLIERKITDRGNLQDPIQLPITRKAWLLGMLNGQDLLSAEAHPLGGEDEALWKDSNPELGHRLRGMAGLGDKMDLLAYKGRENKSAIIEFRARQASLPYNLWPGYAFRMHEFFSEVNQGERHGVFDLEAG